MIGIISYNVGQALREWPGLKSDGINVSITRATDNTISIENIDLPLVVVHIRGEEGAGNTYIGGGIRLYFELALYYISVTHDYSMSNKLTGVDVEVLDRSLEVMRCMERTTLLDDIKNRFDFNFQFDRKEDEQTHALTGPTTIPADIQKIVYKCDVEFNPYNEEDVEWVRLKRIELDNNGIAITIIE